jgi:GTP-binding protein
VFVDRVQIELQAGTGGNGCVSFRRERYVPKGGPDGGDGGRGGSVVLVAREGVNNLSQFAGRKSWRAESGFHGQGSNRYGKNGHDLVLYVPPGTLLIDAEAGYVVKDLSVDGDTVVAARGGRGGRGNLHFKTSTNRAPREASAGETGEVRRFILELKMIADVGLLGKPNAGKSTLLSRLTSARPEIANYPFTTKTPHLGLVQLDLDRSFVIADIPGLIEGAHRGAGLGFEFLRHVERNRVLVHLVEPAPMDGTDPLENYRTIRHELAEYDAKLARRPEVVVVTKAELPEAVEAQQRLEEELGSPVLLISAVTGQNLHKLIQQVWETLQTQPAASFESLPPATHENGPAEDRAAPTASSEHASNPPATGEAAMREAAMREDRPAVDADGADSIEG